MELFLAIAGIIAAGALIAYAVVLTIRWLKNKIRELLAKRNIKKVVAMDIERLIEECPNQKTLDDLEDDYDMVVASVNDSGKVEDIEVIKDDGGDDYKVDEFLGDNGMIVVSG